MQPQRIIIVFSVVLLCSCLSSRNNIKEIKEVAYNYSYAMANYRVDDAEPYCTEETQNSVLRKGRELMEMVQPGYIESDTPATITIEKVELTSDSTATAYYHKTTPIKDMRGEVPLVLRNGEWLVHIVLQSRKSNETPNIIHGNVNDREIVGFPKKK